MVNYYDELPEGYKEAVSIDFKNTKYTLALNFIGLLIAVITAVPIVILGGGIRKYAENITAVNTVLLIVFLVLYSCLHELIHGISFKFLTHKKLKFGFGFLVAYCSLPKTYITRRTGLISLSAPFIFFSIVYITLMIIFRSVNIMYYFLIGVLFSVHTGSCIGDFHQILLLLFKFKDPRTLSYDYENEPKMTIYIPE